MLRLLPWRICLGHISNKVKDLIRLHINMPSSLQAPVEHFGEVPLGDLFFINKLYAILGSDLWCCLSNISDISSAKNCKWNLETLPLLSAGAWAPCGRGELVGWRRPEGQGTEHVANGKEHRAWLWVALGLQVTRNMSSSDSKAKNHHHSSNSNTSNVS